MASKEQLKAERDAFKHQHDSQAAATVRLQGDKERLLRALAEAQEQLKSLQKEADAVCRDSIKKAAQADADRQAAEDARQIVVAELNFTRAKVDTLIAERDSANRMRDYYSGLVKRVRDVVEVPVAQGAAGGGGSGRATAGGSGVSGAGGGAYVPRTFVPVKDLSPAAQDAIKQFNVGTPSVKTIPNTADFLRSLKFK